MVTMKKVTIQYFALLREERGLDEEEIQTEVQTLEELYAALKAQHHFKLDTDVLRVALNRIFVPWGSEFNNGDEVVFIPPVAGG